MTRYAISCLSSFRLSPRPTEAAPAKVTSKLLVPRAALSALDLSFLKPLLHLASQATLQGPLWPPGHLSLVLLTLTQPPPTPRMTPSKGTTHTPTHHCPELQLASCCSPGPTSDPGGQQSRLPTCPSWDSSRHFCSFSFLCWAPLTTCTAPTGPSPRTSHLGTTVTVPTLALTSPVYTTAGEPCRTRSTSSMKAPRYEYGQVKVSRG